MKRYILRCSSCGMEESITEIDLQFNNKCFACGEDVEVTEVPEVSTDNISETIEKTRLLQIENDIEVMGHSRVWEIIEGISDAKIRGRYRLDFFKVGGKVPEQ